MCGNHCGDAYLARSLDIETTAEGVETVEQYRLLRLAGVTSLQGYLFQPPCPSSEIDFDSAYNISRRSKMQHSCTDSPGEDRRQHDGGGNNPQ